MKTQTIPTPSEHLPEGAFLHKRFWGWVDQRGPEDCWEWKGYRTPKGYGQFQVSRAVGPKRANRIAYLLHTGEEPGDLKVLHRCDNPPCCNPAHLFLGTQADNVRDMHEKGRQGTFVPKALRGEDNPAAVLTQEGADEIRRLYSTGDYKQRELSAMFGVNQQRISKIVRGLAW